MWIKKISLLLLSGITLSQTNIQAQSKYSVKLNNRIGASVQKAYVDEGNTEESKTVKYKVGNSYTSLANTKENWRDKNPSWNFKAIIGNKGWDPQINKAKRLIIADDINPFKIVYFGSSVPYGQGATARVGYTALYTQILNDRAKNGNFSWQTQNISIPGNNTVSVLGRYTRDLIPQKSKYVIFALALGNEGIHENGKVAFEQFKRNIQILIQKARADGFTPVLTNSYTRNDYNEIDYQYIKQMNLFIHLLDVPSINLLGAVDNLAGNWSDGYWADGAHPNDKGHQEMAYTMVPSLFDALHAHKKTPQKLESSSIRLKKRSHTSLKFTPENIVHPFTVAFAFKTSSSGNLLTLQGPDGKMTISVEKGVLKYTSPNGKIITGKAILDDKKWHKVILSNYYAEGITTLYCDSISQGDVKQHVVINNFKIGGEEISKKVFYKDLMFWRSGMNAEEVKYIARDSLLKSSLELYAPLNGKKKKLNSSNIINIAQSENDLLLEK